MGHAAIYCRVSTADQADRGTSLDAQERACSAFAAEQGYEVAGVHKDDCSGAVAHLDRPAFAAAWQSLVHGHVDAIICLNMDRLGRDDYASSLAMVGRSREHGDGIVLVGEGEDRDSDSAVMQRGMEAVIAAVERRKIRQRTRQGIRSRWQNGDLGTGKPPYGIAWDSDTMQWSEDGKHADAVRCIFRLRLQGNGYTAIRNELERMGFPPPNALRPGYKQEPGRPYWVRNTIGLMLRNPRYMGVYPVDYAGVCVHAPGAEVPEEYTHLTPVERADYPIVVEPDIWHRAQTVKLSAPKPPSTKHSNLLAGRIYCGLCGLKYRSRVHNKNSSRSEIAGRKYYSCKGRAQRFVDIGVLDERCTDSPKPLASQLDAIVVDDIIGLLSEPAAYRKMVQDGIDDCDQQIAALEAKLAPDTGKSSELVEQLQRVRDLYEMGDIERAEYRNKRDDLQARLARLEGQATEQQGHIEALDSLREKRSYLREMLDSDPDVALAMALNSSDPGPEPFDTSRAVLMEHADQWVQWLDIRVTVFPDAVEVSTHLSGGPFAPRQTYPLTIARTVGDLLPWRLHAR